MIKISNDRGLRSARRKLASHTNGAEEVLAVAVTDFSAERQMRQLLLLYASEN